MASRLEMNVGAVVDTLLRHSEPSIRWKTRVQVLAESPTSRQVCALREDNPWVTVDALAVLRHAGRVRV